MSKKRGKLELSEEEFERFTYGEDLYDEDDLENPQIVLVEEQIIYYDYEKSYVDKEIIVRRVSDNKFFRGTYSKWGAGNTEIDSTTLEEVFPRKVTKTIYE